MDFIHSIRSNDKGDINGPGSIPAAMDRKTGLDTWRDGD
jgi:hypothetical protein